MSSAVLVTDSQLAVSNCMDLGSQLQRSVWEQ